MPCCCCRHAATTAAVMLPPLLPPCCHHCCRHAATTAVGVLRTAAATTAVVMLLLLLSPLPSPCVLLQPPLHRSRSCCHAIALLPLPSPQGITERACWTCSDRAGGEVVGGLDEPYTLRVGQQS